MAGGLHRHADYGYEGLPARLDFSHGVVNAAKAGYNRTLDVSTGVAAVSYVSGNATYTREAFGSSPANVSLTRDQNTTAQSVDLDARTLHLAGHGRQDGFYKFSSQVRRLALPRPGDREQGTVRTNGTALMIRDVSEAWLFYNAESSFHNPDADRGEVLNARLDAAVKKGLRRALRTEAVSDYRKYYDRASLDLGGSGANGELETPARLEGWKRAHNDISGDLELLALAFNMGKYLLIQSSRPGTLPVNLQGVCGTGTSTRRGTASSPSTSTRR